jgi:hypothetical protein
MFMALFGLAVFALWPFGRKVVRDFSRKYSL